jgi:hypothetical protein
MYPKAKPEDWKQFENLEITDEKGNLFIPFGGFLIESGNKKILMDLGLGTETVTFPGFGAVNAHTYLKNLEKTGIKSEEITDFFILTYIWIIVVGQQLKKMEKKN